MDNLDDIVLDSDVFQENRIKKGPLSNVYGKVSNAYSKAKAFTITELLVVISVSALLMAILFPALNRAREQAGKVVCRSNLRQIGILQEIYADAPENNGYLPWSGFQNGKAYQDFELDCYKDKKVRDDDIFSCPGDRYNREIQINDYNDVFKMIDVKGTVFRSYLAQNPFLKEEIALRNTMSSGGEIATFWDIMGGYNEPRKDMNHGVGGGNVLYLDSHTEWLKKEEWEQVWKPMTTK